MVTILSIDGGGIRGLLPAMVLQEIRRRLDSQKDYRNFSNLFNLIAGTSTGALIALGLSLKNKDGSAGFPPDKIVDLYKYKSAEIFPLNHNKMVHTAFHVFRNKFSAAPFENLLFDFFGDTKMSDADTNLLITSFDTERMQPHCMKNRLPAEKWPEDFDFFMRDAARASAAAPTFFPPALISPAGTSELRYSLIDGAAFANNPAGLAYVEATKIFPDEKEFTILSLGTGKNMHGFTYDEIHSWGYVEWVNPMKGVPFAAMMSAGQSEAVNHQLSRIDNVRFIRINTVLDSGSTSIDDAGKENINNLENEALKMISQNENLIDEVCRLLEKQS